MAQGNDFIHDRVLLWTTKFNALPVEILYGGILLQTSFAMSQKEYMWFLYV